MNHTYAVACLTLVSLSSAASAQTADSTRQAARVPLFESRDATIAVAFATATVLLLPFDRSLAVQMQEQGTQSNQFLRHVATGFRVMGGVGALATGGSLYAIGRLGHHAGVADLGLHSLEAIAVGSLATNVVKGLAGRARPYVVGDTIPDNFQFTRGFRKGTSYASFPSGHTTVAFALASTLTAETSRWWPKSKWLVASLAYSSATLVGVSRMYNDSHWASDVIVGAAIGTFSGLKVVRYNHSHRNNRLDRWLLSTSVHPLGTDGVALTWSIKP